MKDEGRRRSRQARVPGGVVGAITLLLAASLACTIGVAPRSVLDTATPTRATATIAAPSATASRPSATAPTASATETLFVPPTLTPAPAGTVSATAAASSTGAPSATAPPNATAVATGPGITPTALGGGAGVLIYNSSVISTAYDILETNVDGS